ncbi:hypothetical protein [Thiothrix nivea]|uniref:Uncharacterized protein n=1 Tax=Thiothrix nivea (strain ATCC 35100 / DSM 5205 / JP2) TaxID=870187 RepID=A0A656HK78_THINJ|nr:hypothetical protein [Thiothrix nivea]EIJ35720.1 hypothetical protein Thini_3198 [Thiothrix nivea DSM 5205]
MELKNDVGNPWGMTDGEMEYYGKLSTQHQEYLPWLFINYDEEAESNALNIKKSINIMQNRKANIKVWQYHYKWNIEHERAKHFLSASMSIHHLAMLVFPFLSQEQEYKVFCGAVVSMICNQSIQVSSFPWQGEYYQLVEPYIGQKAINALTDERSSIQLYSNLTDSGLKNLAKVAHAEFVRATVKNWHLSKCAEIWTSYLEYMTIHGALPSRLHFGVEYRGEQPEILIQKQEENHFKSAKERRNTFAREFKEYAERHRFDSLGDIPRDHKSAYINEFADRYPQDQKAGESKEERRNKYIATLNKDWEILQQENPPRIGKGFTTNQT